MMKKRLIAIALATIVGVTSLVGCSKKVDPNAPTKITFWHSMGGKGGEAITALVEEFNNSQDKIYVSAEYQGTYNDSVNKLKSSMIGNAGPDVMQLFDIGTKWMIDSEYALVMQDLIDKANFDTSQLEENILDYYAIDGTLYSMPFNTSTPILYYNKDAFREVGLDPEVTPKTFDEIIEFSEKLFKKNGNNVERYGFAMQVYGWLFEEFLSKQNLTYVNNSDGRKGNPTEVEFNSNGGALTIYDAWKKIVDSGVVGNFGRSADNTTDAFVSGTSCMMISSTANLANIKSKINGTFELGTAYIPAVNDEGKGGVSVGGGSLWIMDNGDDKRAEAAFEFIKFMISPDSQAEWAAKTGYFPITKEAYELEKMQEHLANNPEFKTAVDQLREPNNRPGALLGVFSEARAATEEGLEKVLNNELSPEEAVNMVSEKINKALKKYNRYIVE